MRNIATTPRRRLLRWGKWAAQAVILVLVVWGIRKTMDGALAQMASAGVRPNDLDPRWLILSGLGYLAALYPCSYFWRRVLQLMKQQPDYWQALRAYFVSQPGKYVPGKFMVVLLRTVFIRGPRVDTTLATAATFVETLTMMSLGAALGAVLMSALVSDWRLVAFAMVAAVAVGVPALPPVFRTAAKWTKLHRLHPEIDEALAGLHLVQLAPGWTAIVLGWFAMGFSLWAALRSIPGAVGPGHSASDFLLLTSCAAVSTVAGFASGLPGGLGAREWVVMALIAPQFGELAAVLSAVIHRGVMIAAELAVCAVLLLPVVFGRTDRYYS